MPTIIGPGQLRFRPFLLLVFKAFARLEDCATSHRAGGRVIESGELALYWKNVYKADFGSCGGNPGERHYSFSATPYLSRAQPCPSALRSTQYSMLNAADDWKSTYLAKDKEMEEKRARVGKKVRGMWDEEKRKKDLKRIQVMSAQLL